jgi:hypothetical protein
MNQHHRLLILALVAVVPLGCRDLLAGLAQLGPKPKKKVAAEFNRLAGHKVLVLAWVEPGALIDYPTARFDVASHIAAHLSAHVEEIDIIDPTRVEDHLEKSYTMAHDAEEVGKKFGADMIVYVELSRFSMRDPATPHEYRGRAESSVVVYDRLVPEGENNRFELTPVRIAVPKEGPISVSRVNPTQIRRAACDELAAQVAQRFYDHEVEL